MSIDTIFLIVEYSGIPIALMLYSVIIKQLSNSDPISGKEKTDEIWSYGLELMVITSVSTLLYGLSFLSHTNGETLTNTKLYCIIWCFGISIIEFFFLIYVTLKVRSWGRENKKSKIATNLIAALYLTILIGLILICTSYTHTVTHTETQPPVILDTNTQKRKKVAWYIILLGVVACVIIFFSFKWMIKKIKKKAVEEYNKGSRLLSNDPNKSINILQESLKKLPDDSPLLIDIRMKLSRIYVSLSENKLALQQIELLEKTAAYNELQSYLKDSVIKKKAELLMALNKHDEAKNIIELIATKETADKLRLKLFGTQEGQ